MGGWKVNRKISDFAFELSGDEPGLEPFALQLYSGARLSENDRIPEAAESFRLSRRQERYVLSRGNTELCQSSDLAVFFRRAEWAITKAAMEGLSCYFQIHAGAVASADGRRLRLIVGPPDSGKTSLVLACAETGARILTDEIALVDGPLLAVAPFPRDLVVHDGTRAALGGFLSRVENPPWKMFQGYSFVAPEAVSRQPPQQGMVTQLVFPTRRPGESTAVERLGESAAAELLLGQIFNLRIWGARGVEIMARMVETSAAYSVSFDDARAAVRCLPDLEVQT